MTAISYQDLLSHLQRAPSLMTTVKPDSPALTPRPDRTPGYVEPELLIEEWPDGATTLVIEASAATGKTALANTLAADLLWPLVHGNTMQVGNYTIQGLINDVGGFSPSYMEAIVARRGGIVLDAMDEAQLRAGQANFLSCLHDLQAIHIQSSHEPGIRTIVLARRDCAQVIALYLQELAVPYARAELQFFSLPKAVKFVEESISSQSGRKAERIVETPLSQPYRDLLKRRFEEIAESLVGDTVVLEDRWGELASMLGYPPVLSALAQLISVRNPTTEKPMSARGRAEILVAICHSILEREKNKVRDALVHQLEARVPAGLETGTLKQIYEPLEQVMRLADEAFALPLIDRLPAGLPQAVRTDYEDQVREFFNDHPFYQGGRFASLVFSDYIKARLIVDDPEEMYVIGNPEDRAIDPGPFFARFVSVMSPPDFDTPRGALFGVIQSLMLERDWIPGGDTLIQIVVGRQNAAIQIRGSKSDEFFLKFGAGSSDQEFPGNMRRAIVTVAGQATLKAAGLLRLGPSLLLGAQTIELEGNTVEIHGSKDEASILVADRILGNGLKGVSGDTRALVVSTKEYPPLLYPSVPSGHSGWHEVPISSFMDLRAILLSFGSSVSEGVACSADKLDLVVIRERPNRIAILKALMERGAITHSGQIYRLNLSEIGKLGFGLGDLINEPTQPVLRFLVEVSQQEQD